MSKFQKTIQIDKQNTTWETVQNSNLNNEAKLKLVQKNTHLYIQITNKNRQQQIIITNKTIITFNAINLQDMGRSDSSLILRESLLNLQINNRFLESKQDVSYIMRLNKINNINIEKKAIQVLQYYSITTQKILNFFHIEMVVALSIHFDIEQCFMFVCYFLNNIIDQNIEDSEGRYRSKNSYLRMVAMFAQIHCPKLAKNLSLKMREDDDEPDSSAFVSFVKIFFEPFLQNFGLQYFNPYKDESYLKILDIIVIQQQYDFMIKYFLTLLEQNQIQIIQQIQQKIQKHSQLKIQHLKLYAYQTLQILNQKIQEKKCIEIITIITQKRKKYFIEMLSFRLQLFEVSDNVESNQKGADVNDRVFEFRNCVIQLQNNNVNIDMNQIELLMEHFERASSNQITINFEEYQKALKNSINLSSIWTKDDEFQTLFFTTLSVDGKLTMHLKSVNLGLLLLSTMSIQEKLLEILLLYNDYRLNISKEEVFKTLSIVENRIDNRSTFIQKSKADLMFKGNSLLKLDDAISLILEDQNCQSLLMMITAIVKQGTGERVFDDNIIDDPDDQNQNFMSSIIFGKSSLIQEENVSSSEINQSNDLSSSNKIVNQSILNDDQILEKQGKHEIVAKPKIAKKCLKKKSIRSPEKSRFDILSQMISTKKQVSFDLSKNQTSYIDFKQIINHNKQNVPVDNSWMVSFNEQQNLQQKVFKRNSISKQNSLDYNQSQEKDQDEQKQCLIF